MFSFLSRFKSKHNKAGGQGYHRQAQRYRDDQWQSFIQPLERQLLSWPQKSKTLSILAPSGGYCLTDHFLSRYDKIVLNDVDPVCLEKFQMTHPRANLEFYCHDFFNSSESSFQPEGFLEWSSKTPQADLLVSNFLGQIPVISKKAYKDPNFPERLRSIFQQSIKERNWFSFHDLYSCKGYYPEIDADLLQALASQTQPGQGKADNYLIQVFKMAKQNEFEVIDHLTLDFFEGLSLSSKCVLPWQRTKDYFHLIEAVY